jgi:DNA-binding NtrC family response regulator
MKDSVKGFVLVVEDKQSERDALIALLRNAGYSARAVAGAAPALDALNDPEASIDVVLCDLRLGTASQTGVDLLRQWKRRRPATPFIFVTGVFDIAQVVEAVKLGAEDYITKPYKPAELLHRVEDCIKASREGSSEHLPAPLGAESRFNDLQLPNDITLEDLCRIAVEQSLRRFGGNRTHAANALGVSVRTLQRKLKAWASEREEAATIF